MDVPIETERLRLRKYEDRDVADILEFSADADYWLARNCDWEVSAEGVRRYWEAQREVDPGTDPKWFSLVVELKAAGKAIGEVGIGVIRTDEKRNGTIGWALGRKYQGQGLAAEAARAMLRFGFEQMGLHRIAATTSAENLRSWRLMERLGMRREAHFRESDTVNGEWRDEFVYALLADEWKARAKASVDPHIRSLHLPHTIIARIERGTGVPGLAAILAERLPPTDLQSLLLAVYHRRSSLRRPTDVLSQYESDRFVRPAPVSPERLLAWEEVACASLPAEFELLALAPVCPLGTCAAVASVDPNWSVATVRNTEVVSDATNVLALECALRRRALLRGRPKSTTSVHLAASQRLLRGQHYGSPLDRAHFACFALCSAGRDQGNLRFELAALRVHIGFYLRALRAFLEPAVPLCLTVTDWHAPARADMVEAELLAPLKADFATVDRLFDDQRTSGRGYYRDLCFHIEAANPAGQALLLVDGGVVDWTQRLLSDAKERMVISGIGSERLCTEF